MSHVNGDDIDDIFRRASERYPLRIDGADWGKLAADLESNPSLILPARNAEGEDRRRKRFLWLLLLLPLGGLGYYTLQMTGHTTAHTRSIVENNTKKATTSPGLPVNSASDKSPVAPDATKTSSAATSASRGTTGGTTMSRGIASVTSSSRETTIAARSTNSNATRSIRSHSGHFFNGGSTPTTLNNRPANNETRPTGFDPSTDISRQSGSVSQTFTTVPPASDSRHFDPYTLQRARTTGGINLAVNVKARQLPAAPAPTKLAKTHASSFYAGLIFAPDFSSVKFQSVRNVGTTYGLLLGYNINKNWAIESGLYLDRKKYYTEGQYFNTKKITVPPNVKISDVDGYCDMWEIPINIRYNFSQGEKLKWFATAGFSTYLMTNEHYNYQFEYMSGGSSWPYSKQYNTNSNYLFSIVNLSVGFEQNLGKVGNLRLEPYLRVPLAGLGTGSLPIMSAGLNIGITRRIW